MSELRQLARAHAPAAIKELARLAVRARSEAARVAAIRELLDRGYGKATQYLAAENEPLPPYMTSEEARVELFEEFAKAFPEYKIVPMKRPAAIPEPNTGGLTSRGHSRQRAASNGSSKAASSRYHQPNAGL